MSAVAALAHHSFTNLELNMASKPVKSITTAQRNIAKHIYNCQFVLTLHESRGFGSVTLKREPLYTISDCYVGQTQRPAKQTENRSTAVVVG